MTPPPTSDAPLESRRAQAAEILVKFLKDNPEWKGDAFVCTHAEWVARGERYGKNSLATLVVDGSPLYNALNGCSDDKIVQKLDKTLAAAGLYLEGGYAWSGHLYNT